MSTTPATATTREVAATFHDRTVDEVLEAFAVDPRTGLSSDEVVRRREEHGTNELDEAPRDPSWKRFARQFKDLLILILLAAAVVSFVVSGELKTPIVVLVVVLLNAVIGFVQENRAEASLDALRRMLVLEVRVRREGTMRTVPAAELVPGDVVAVEAGDRIPADGRVIEAVQLEVEEAALTGESLPVTKTPEPAAGDDLPVADRTSMVHMQTTVTRGRGELVVTTTGMGTEIGRIAGLLREAAPEKTPLQRQLDQLAHSLAKLAGVIVGLVFLIGLIRGEDISDLLLTAVALAVASIPEGLPAVTAVTLAIGVSKMARENAIVKRLASVETLGSTTVICSDKTGTLTLNQMTAEEIVVTGRRLAISGNGYAPEGEIHGLDDVPIDLDEVLEPMALCSDATVRFDDEEGVWRLVGDPTEGALVVLAGKGGVDPATRRAERPRVGEVPFDSAHKLMATLHESESGLRMYAKGAPDAILDRSTTVLGYDGTIVPVEELREELEEHNARLAGSGMRVLAVARRAISRDEWNGDGDLDAVTDLTFLALIGIVDPPREEARAAIEEAGGAGISVKMITGDHASTASAIGEQLNLGGGDHVVAVTGRDLDAMSDEELAERVDDISVFARVSPEHKLRLVSALQKRGHVVAMTGDGVNDAPALRRADMGIAMGITGTEVTKEAATMVLADDNFATIIEAVRRGRTIYDNIVKFVRFQLSTTLGFATIFLAASIFGIASGQPFTAIAILWVNIIMDGPPAMALGLDPVDERVMGRDPRPPGEPILTRPRWTAIGQAAVVMAAGTLAVLAFAPGPEPIAGEATVAGTMAFNTFVLYQFFNILNVRSDQQTVFRRATFRNSKLWIALAAVIALQIGVTHVGPMQELFDTTSISAMQWLVCLGVASTVLLTEELRKIWRRSRTGEPAT
ncbi:HAD-IC family P-type ATPase [Acidimicrobiia bacterium EGI L10123]|uniref:cation-translocating P-type ATPase n=1 Tax=Salinilacustrithrix flava TaxID=2957203 RepID=UPI003D7C234B|nr:HAD-IC family P-type ATPase [Acidimicrobiia bacterium EGI L10123]